MNLFYHPWRLTSLQFFYTFKNERYSFIFINFKKCLTKNFFGGIIFSSNSFTKPYEKKSSLDGHSTESPVLVRWVTKSLDEDGL